MNGPKYLIGAKVLATSLLATNTKYPIILMVTNDVEIDDEIKVLFNQVIQIDYIKRNCKPLMTKMMQHNYTTWIESSFTKLNVFNKKIFTDFDKLIYLDADQLVIKNIDHLFQLSTPALSFDSEFSNKYHINGIYNPYQFVKHGETIHHTIIQRNFNDTIVGSSGTIVLTPSNEFFSTLMFLLYKQPDIPYGFNLYNGFEEQILAETFIHLGISPTHLSKLYCWNAGHYKLLDNATLYVVNYYGLKKPWLDRPLFLDNFIWLYFRDLMKKYVKNKCDCVFYIVFFKCMC